MSFKNLREAGVSEEQRLEYVSGSLVGREVVRSWESINATFSLCVEGCERREERSERPAGPPPMQTTS